MENNTRKAVIVKNRVALRIIVNVGLMVLFVV